MDEAEAAGHRSRRRRCAGPGRGRSALFLSPSPGDDPPGAISSPSRWASRKAFGVVWALRDGAGDNLKPVSSRLDLPPLPAKLRGFIDWVAAWTLAPAGHGAAHGHAGRAEAGAEPVRLGLRATGAALKRETPGARKRRWRRAQGGLAFEQGRTGAAGWGLVGVIDGLIDEGALEPVALPPEKAAGEPDPDFSVAPPLAGSGRQRRRPCAKPSRRKRSNRSCLKA